MFETALVDLRNAPRSALALSSVVQLCALGVLLLLPLLYTQGLPAIQLRSVLAAPPPPPVPQRTITQMQTRPAAARIFSVPATIVSHAVTTQTEPLIPPPEVGISASSTPGEGVYEGTGSIPTNI